MNESGGSAGDVVLDVVQPREARFNRVSLDGPGMRGSKRLQGELADTPRDLSGDGVVDLVLEDGRFAYKFGCGGCTPRPPLIFTIRGGQSVDVSRDPAFAPIFRRDMNANKVRCRSQDSDRNGACAAYAADAARLGLFDRAFADVLRWYDHEHYDGVAFPARLKAFLRKIGYVA